MKEESNEKDESVRRARNRRRREDGMASVDVDECDRTVG